MPAKCTCSKCSLVLLICFSVRALKTLQWVKDATSYKLCTASLFMGEFERKALQKYADKPHLWPRYIDDISMVWTHGEEKLDEFIKYLNDIHPTISLKPFSLKFTTPPSTNSTFQTKRSFQNSSHHKPKHSFKTSLPCTTIFSPKKTATINLFQNFILRHKSCIQ